MIKNYLTYIRENVEFDEPPINLKDFTPKYVFDYYKEKYCEKDKMFRYCEWTKMYVDFILKTLEIDKYIIFNGNSPGESNELHSGYIKKVLQPDNQKAIIHIILDDGIEYGMYPGETVRIFDKEPEKIYREEDPYGEEEWY